MNTEQLAIILNATDRATPVFRGFMRTLDQASQAAARYNQRNQQIAGQLNQIRTAVTSATSPFRTLAGVIGRLSATPIRAVSTALSHVGPAARTAAQGVNTLAGAVRGLLGPIGTLGTILGAVSGAGIVAGMAKIATTGVDMNLTLAGAHTALTKLLGSSQAAGGFLRELESEAAKSIPTLKDLVPLAVQLVQAYGPSNLGKVLPTIRAFGDAAAIAAGGDTGRLNLALLGFRQMLSRGFAQQEELNQIGENLGVSVTNILVKAFGTADTEVLKEAGVTGMQVADAIVAGFQEQFGGAQAGAAKTIPGLLSNLTDAFGRGSGQAAQGLTGSLGRGLGSLLDSVNAMLDRGTLIQSLAVVFDLLGRAIEWAGAQAAGFFGWLEKIATADGVKLFLLNVISLIQTLGEWFGTVFGIDIPKLLDPKNIYGWFQALAEGVTNAVNFGFGLMRVFGEVFTMARSGFEDVRNWISDAFQDASLSAGDFMEDIRRAMHRLGVESRLIFLQIGEGVLTVFSTVLAALSTHPFFAGVFKGLPAALNTAATGFSIGQQAVQGDIDRLNQEDWDLTNQRIARTFGIRDARAARESALRRQDPFRGQNPMDRLMNAFTGQGRDTLDQDRFWGMFMLNRQQNFRDWFKPPNQGPFPGAPSLYNQMRGMTDQRGDGGFPWGILGISTPPQVTAPTSAYDFSPVAAGGGIMSRFAAEQRGLLGGMSVQQQMAAGMAQWRQDGSDMAIDRWLRSSGGRTVTPPGGWGALEEYQMRQGGGGPINVNINLPGLMDSDVWAQAQNDPAFVQMIYRVLQEWYYRQSQTASPGPSY